jgi:hypothetical protein
MHPVAALQSATVAQVLDVSVWPFAAHVRKVLFEQRVLPGVQASHSPPAASQRFGHVWVWSCCPSLEQWCSTGGVVVVHE